MLAEYENCIKQLYETGNISLKSELTFSNIIQTTRELNCKRI